MFPLRRSALPLLCAIALVPALAPTSANALVSSAQPIDGPSSAIRELGGVAMSADGTGGLVFRKDDGGRPHIFAAQYVNGAWQRPQRVDLGPDQGFESAWPTIAAGDGGRLLVVWTQEFGLADRMYSATLQPGSRRFEAPVPVDLNVGDMSLGTWPTVSMAPGGQAYLVYRVITDAQPSSAPPGSVLGEYRLARYTGQLWAGFGIPINRNLESAQSAPTAADRPVVGTDQLGNAVVAWEELDDQFVPRVYARRVFPSATGVALQVTPSTLGGKPLNAGVAQFSLAVGAYGEAAVAWRQSAPPAGSGGGFSRARVLVVQSPDEFSPSANAFGDPRAFDGGGDEGPAGGVGDVRVAVSAASAIAAFSHGGAALAADGDDQTVQAPVRLDDGGGQDAADPDVALGSTGAAAFAWKRNAGARGGLVARERRSDGVVSERQLSAPRGGTVDALRVAGSGLGDALVAWTQGTGAGRQIAAAWVDAPPDTFNAQTPLDWVRGRTVPLQWDPAPHSIGGVSYTVVVDGDTIADGLASTTFPLPTAAFDDGRRVVTVVATDAAGQETTSVPATLKIDRTAPRVRVRLNGRRVRVAVGDGRASGTDAGATAIGFGDGARSAGRGSATHRYRRPGTYRIAVRVRDRAGNARLVRRTVRVR